MTTYVPPQLAALPQSLPLEGAVTIDQHNGIPVLRASERVQSRIEELLAKQRGTRLNEAEERELDGYGEVDDYLSFLNRTVRNLYLTQARKTA